MPDNDIFIFGASDHARVIIDIVELEGRYRIRGLLDTYKPKGMEVAGYPILGAEEDLPALMLKYGVHQGILGIGDNWTRRRITRRLQELASDFKFVNAIHPSARVTRDAKLGPGTVVMAFSYVGLNTTVEEGSVIATRSMLEHDGAMGPFATLGAGTVTGGRVTLGACAAVCLGVTIIHGISVGDHTVIGSGSTVIDDIPDHAVAYGSPARVVRRRRPSDTYLHMRSESARSAQGGH
jgi:sugar O-acyltransferase (sialic acid O-acetyltransferase NeuD family)